MKPHTTIGGSSRLHRIFRGQTQGSVKWDFGKAGVVNESDLEVVQTKRFGWWFQGFLI